MEHAPGLHAELAAPHGVEHSLVGPHIGCITANTLVKLGLIGLAIYGGFKLIQKAVA